MVIFSIPAWRYGVFLPFIWKRPMKDRGWHFNKASFWNRWNYGDFGVMEMGPVFPYGNLRLKSLEIAKFVRLPIFG